MKQIKAPKWFIKGHKRLRRMNNEMLEISKFPHSLKYVRKHCGEYTSFILSQPEPLKSKLVLMCDTGIGFKNYLFDRARLENFDNIKENELVKYNRKTQILTFKKEKMDLGKEVKVIIQKFMDGKFLVELIKKVGQLKELNKKNEN